MDGLTGFSNVAFGIALVLYLLGAVGYFHYLAFRRRGVLAGGRAVAIAGVAVHVTSVAARGAAAGRVPWGNMFEYVTVVGLLIVVAYLVLERLWRTEAVGGFVLALVVGAMAAVTLIYVPPGPLVPALNSYWLRIHVVAAMLGSALFTLSAVFTVLYLVRDRQERKGAISAAVREPVLAAVGGGIGERPEDYTSAEPEPDGAGSARRSRLPAGAVLDRIAYRTVVFAFPIWTMAVIFGAIWAEQAWGRYWGWDPKEVWAFVTWVLFASYLHARATVGWRGRRAAVLALLGFVALVFNLIVVNTVISGLHSYAT